MLERISKIKGIGLLHNANGASFSCKRATLIYGDNGRGKSTLATILHSVATNEPLTITNRKTIDGKLPVEVELQFNSGHKVFFRDGAWTEKRPEFLVFDADFIGRNVHSGGAVNTTHRQNLLNFALGDAAVTARQAEDKATADWSDASERVRMLKGKLSGHQEGMLIDEFKELARVDKIDEQIEDLQKKVRAAENVAAIQGRRIPGVIVEPTFDINGLFEVLATTLHDIHTEAEKTVTLHVHKLGMPEAEDWLSKGRQFSNDISCPFCNQDISNNDLVRAYQTHFNAEYANLKSRVAVEEQKLLKGIADSIVTDFSNRFNAEVARAEAWKEQVLMEDISFDDVAASDKLKELREFLVKLVNQKQAAPAESFGSSANKAKAVDLWTQFLSHLKGTNSALDNIARLVNTYKTQLSGENVVPLKQQVQLLKATKRRYAPLVNDLFVALGAAENEAQDAETAKNTAREKLVSSMTDILQKYQNTINDLLKNFGASFTIDNMSSNFLGKGPRTEYKLLLRNRSIKLEKNLKSEDNQPLFEATLSDGDKRTLAFAFFVACILDDPKLADRIVVIDDPMCSLDRNRRNHTKVVLKQIYEKALQVVILAHDAYFIRDLRDAFSREDNTSPIEIFQLRGANQDYTDFAKIDIDRECESSYARHYRLLSEYPSGSNQNDWDVAIAIRPMLEGYLHRRFSAHLPKDILFGQVVSLIRDATTSSPFFHAQNLVKELNEINDYAGKFHHDTNRSTDVTPSELKTYVERALNVVYGVVR